MKLTAEMVKEFAKKIGCGDVGIANIERFSGAPRMMHPKNVFPDCKSVISIVHPFPRGSYRGITEGTHWTNYTYYSYNRLNMLVLPSLTYELATFLEDNGAEAVPMYPGVPETPGLRPCVLPGRPAPEININVRIAGVACGLGEIGWSKVFIHPKFGPRVRLSTILTDLELQPDELIEPGTLCNRCMRCVKDCPGGAIPKSGEKPPVQIRIEDKVYEWGDVHMGRCTLTHHGMNSEISPFLKKSFPGLKLNVRQTNMSEESAYRLCYPIGLAKWPASYEFPESDAVVGYYNQILQHVKYFAVCGAKGCIRACMDSLEKRHIIEQSNFKTPVFPRPNWKLPLPEEDNCGGIPEGKFPEVYNQPDSKPGCWD